MGSADEGLPGGLLRFGYRHSAALDRGQPQLFGRRIRILVSFAEAVATEQEDL
jgi:hypothetical protein